MGENFKAVEVGMRDEFSARGFVLVEDVFSGAEVEQLAAVLERALIHRNAEEQRPLEQRAALNRQLTHCFNLWEDEPLVREFVFDPRVCSVAANLMDTTVLRLFLDQTFFKEPSAEPTSKHQDITRWPVRGRLLTAWIALDDVTRESGALAYVPGSHAVGPSSWLDLVTGRQWTEAQLALIEQAPEYVPVRRGSILFHDSCTFHLSAPNETQRRRRAFSITYAADGTIRSSSLPFPALDWDGIPTGDELKGARNPIVWPRGDMRLPLLPPRPPEEVAGWPFPSACSAG
jgi:ectoine hydroxylase-related dioxygenase (phytanoyl-CoA dioxygenase family)